jgi:hypothetical protein
LVGAGPMPNPYRGPGLLRRTMKCEVERLQRSEKVIDSPLHSSPMSINLGGSPNDRKTDLSGELDRGASERPRNHPLLYRLGAHTHATRIGGATGCASAGTPIQAGEPRTSAGHRAWKLRPLTLPPRLLRSGKLQAGGQGEPGEQEVVIRCNHALPKGRVRQGCMGGNPNLLRDIQLVQAEGLGNGDTLLRRLLRFSVPPSGRDPIRQML